MDSRIAAEERQGFSQRLKDALAANEYSTSPSAFVNEFNLRADGAAVTVHAARKWLVADAIPTQEKVQVLARWLGVSSEWLRFGDDGPLAMATLSLDGADTRLLNDIRMLGERDRKLVEDMVLSMLKRQKR